MSGFGPLFYLRIFDRAVGVISFSNKVYPGEIVLDEQGRKVASTTTIFPVVVAGGRAVTATLS